jgi:hypothetical protein
VASIIKVSYVGLSPRPVRSFQISVEETGCPVAAVIAVATSRLVQGGLPEGHLFAVSQSIFVPSRIPQRPVSLFHS